MYEVKKKEKLWFIKELICDLQLHPNPVKKALILGIMFVFASFLNMYFSAGNSRMVPAF